MENNENIPQEPCDESMITELSAEPDVSVPLAEEIYEALGNNGLVSLAKWPVFDPAKTVDNEVEMPVQINGKVRATVQLPMNCQKDEAIAIAKADERIASAIEGKTVIKEIAVPNKIVNIVVK